MTMELLSEGISTFIYKKKKKKKNIIKKIRILFYQLILSAFLNTSTNVFNKNQV